MPKLKISNETFFGDFQTLCVVNFNSFCSFSETSVLSVQPVESVVSTPNLVKLDPPKLERRSSFNGNVRADINTRITNALQTIREKIPTAVDSVEDDIAISNRDKVILALANFLGSKLNLNFRAKTGLLCPFCVMYCKISIFSGFWCAQSYGRLH